MQLITPLKALGNTLLLFFCLLIGFICIQLTLINYYYYAVYNTPIDVFIFDILRKKIWFIAPLVSSLIGSVIDTFLFFSIAFYGTGLNWFTLSLGDLFVKILVALIMLIPFRFLLFYVKEVSNMEKKINV